MIHDLLAFLFRDPRRADQPSQRANRRLEDVDGDVQVEASALMSMRIIALLVAAVIVATIEMLDDHTAGLEKRGLVPEEGDRGQGVDQSEPDAAVGLRRIMAITTITTLATLIIALLFFLGLNQAQLRKRIRRRSRNRAQLITGERAGQVGRQALVEPGRESSETRHGVLYCSTLHYKNEKKERKRQLGPDPAPLFFLFFFFCLHSHFQHATPRLLILVRARTRHDQQQQQQQHWWSPQRRWR